MPPSLRIVSLLCGLGFFALGLTLWLLVPSADAAIDLWLRQPRDGAIVPWLAGLTHSGGGTALIPVGLAAIAWLIWQRRPSTALWLFATIASGRLLIEFLKYAIDRPRPSVAGQLVTVSTAAFPSSHSAGTVLTGLALILAFRLRPLIAIPIAIWALAIGISRIMLGVHWPSDVLGGWGIGLCCVALASFWLRAGEPQR